MLTNITKSGRKNLVGKRWKSFNAAIKPRCYRLNSSFEYTSINLIGRFWIHPLRYTCVSNFILLNSNHQSLFSTHVEQTCQFIYYLSVSNFLVIYLVLNLTKWSNSKDYEGSNSWIYCEFIRYLSFPFDKPNIISFCHKKDKKFSWSIVLVCLFSNTIF